MAGRIAASNTPKHRSALPRSTIPLPCAPHSSPLFQLYLSSATSEICEMRRLPRCRLGMAQNLPQVSGPDSSKPLLWKKQVGLNSYVTIAAVLCLTLRLAGVVSAIDWIVRELLKRKGNRICAPHWIRTCTEKTISAPKTHHYAAASNATDGATSLPTIKPSLDSSPHQEERQCC